MRFRKSLVHGLPGFPHARVLVRLRTLDPRRVSAGLRPLRRQRLELRRYRFCIKIEYMANTSVMTLRIDSDLLAELKARAVAEGRSTSAEVVSLLRKQIVVKPRRARATPTMGMYAQYEAPDLDELSNDGQALAAMFESSIRKNTRK